MSSVINDSFKLFCCNRRQVFPAEHERLLLPASWVSPVDLAWPSHSGSNVRGYLKTNHPDKIRNSLSSDQEMFGSARLT